MTFFYSDLLYSLFSKQEHEEIKNKEPVTMTGSESSSTSPLCFPSASVPCHIGSSIRLSIPSSITPISLFLCNSDHIRQSLLLSTLHDQVANYLLIEKEKKLKLKQNNVNNMTNTSKEIHQKCIDKETQKFLDNSMNMNAQRNIPAVLLCQRWKMNQSPPHPISLESINKNTSNENNIHQRK